jgi:hypothetical protein
MGLFEYDPLDLDDCSFRLIRLFKADYGLVQCELFHSWLHNKDCAVEYEALSYTWGSTNDLYEIEVNGKKLPVTGNLFLALQQLRFKHQDRILWIDAICIDQSNSKERGHQVRQMSSIYTKAAQVIVWLGQATSDTDLFFHYMQCLEKEALNYACTDWKSSDERWQHIWSDVGYFGTICMKKHNAKDSKKCYADHGSEEFGSYKKLQMRAQQRLCVVKSQSLRAYSRLLRPF